MRYKETIDMRSSCRVLPEKANKFKTRSKKIRSRVLTKPKIKLQVIMIQTELKLIENLPS